MTTLELFLIIIIVLTFIYLTSKIYSRPNEVSRDEDNAYSRIALSREIVKKIAPSEAATKYEDRIVECEEMFSKGDFTGAKKCAESILDELRSFNSKKDQNEALDSNITCSHCGTKLAKKYEFCPICGEKI